MRHAVYRPRVLYREIRPRPELADVVHCLWTLEGFASSDAVAQPVLPDGRPEIILHLGDPFDRVEFDGRRERQPRVMYAGQLQRRLLLRPAGRVAVLGIRFHAHGASALLHIPQYELIGNPTALDSLNGRLTRALERVWDCGDLSQAAAIAESVILRSVDRSRMDARLAGVVALIRNTRGRLSVDALARASHLTRRHLERLFLQDVGLTPKRLARITRFQRALRSLECGESSRRGTDTAAACGYADQSHFIRDFRLLAGCSPGEHLLRQGELTKFFVTGGQEIGKDLLISCLPPWIS